MHHTSTPANRTIPSNHCRLVCASLPAQQANRAPQQEKTARLYMAGRSAMAARRRGSRKTDDRPAMRHGMGLQRGVGIDCHRMADPLQQRQVIVRIAIKR